MSTDDLDQIARLFKLRESGALTDEEFQWEKARVLSGDPPEHSAPSGASHQNEQDAAHQYGSVEEWADAPEPRPKSLKSVVIAAVIVSMVAAGAILYVRQTKSESGNPAAPTMTAAHASTSTPSVSTGTESAPVTLSDAFRAATGHSKAFKITDDEGAKTVSPLRLLHLPFALVLLTKTEMEDGCDACSGSIGVHYLQGSGNSLKAVGHWPDAVRGWGHGLAPEVWKVTDKYTDHPAIFATGSDGTDGYVCGGAKLTELRPEGPKQSDDIPLSYSNGGAIDEETGHTMGGESARDENGEIVNVAKGKSFDVRVRGTDEFTEHYVQTDEKFVRTTRKSRLSC